MSAENETLEGMWKGESSSYPLTDRIDPARTDLFRDFENAPLSRHDLELQLLISGIRGSARLPRYVLVRESIGRWRIAAMSLKRGGAPKLVSPRVFDDQNDAERFVFNIRLQQLAALDLKEDSL